MSRAFRTPKANGRSRPAAALNRAGAAMARSFSIAALMKMLMAVPVSTDAGTFSIGAPRTLFQIHSRPPISSTDLFTYDVTRDGKRFLVNQYVKPEQIPPLGIVLHANEAPAK